VSVFFESFLVRNIGSTPAVIFSQESTCILESLILCNQTSARLKASLYISHREQDGEVVDYSIQNFLTLEAYETVDWLHNKNPQFIHAREIWYAQSDQQDSLFNVKCSYRMLNNNGLAQNSKSSYIGLS
jgi:hypothetical protein